MPSVADALLNDLLKSTSSSRVGAVVRSRLGLLFALGSPASSSASNVSPKRRQRLLQAEAEAFVQLVLAHHVREWAAAVSATQMLDKEVENDLRRALSALLDRARAVDVRRLLREAVAVVACHCRKAIHHPTESTTTTRDAYLHCWTERLLREFGVDRTVSSRLLFQCLCRILTRQVSRALLESFSSPDYLRSVIATTLMGETAQVVSESVKPKQTLSDSARLWHSDQDSSSASASAIPHDYERTVSENSTLKQQRPSQPSTTKRTLDLTGYSLLRGNDDASPVAPAAAASATAPMPSGKISTALGGLFSATAGPLLPSNIAFKSFNKMWRSQSSDECSACRPDSPSSGPQSLILPQQSPTKEAATATPPKAKAKRKKKLLQRFPSFDLDDVIDGRLPSLGDIYSYSQQRRRRHSLTSGEVTPPRKSLFKPASEEASDGKSKSLRLTNGGLDHSFPQPLVFRRSFDANNGIDDDNDDVSPNYEDADDLESSITKLRALLSDRHDKSDDDEGEEVVEEEEENVKVLETLPSDGRLVLNVSIPEAELGRSEDEQPCSLGGGGADDRSNPPLYRVRYEGIYLDGDDGNGYFVQPRSVRRRFKEFLNLQMRLEEQPKLRPLVRAIKGQPNKWLSLPFIVSGRQDEQSLEARRGFLEKWLVALCGQPAVAVSKELMAFLAYGDDGSVAFDRRGADNNGGSNTKIDKVRFPS